MTYEIKDLSEDIADLWDFLPLKPDSLYPESLLQNCVLRENTGFYNNATLNICHFYNYVLHTFLCRLYLSDNQNIELLKYVQTTKEVFSGRDGHRGNVVITRENINVNLFIEIEKESINYFYHILNFDKGNQISKKHQNIIDIRNSVAHLNYILINENTFLSVIHDIKEILQFISEKLYKNTKKVICEEINESFRKGLLDIYNYQVYFDEMNGQNYFSKNDYKLIKTKGLLRDAPQNNYKYYIKLYIENFTDILD